MTDEKSSPLVPTLRFPEFREAGEWMEKSLGEIAEFAKGKGLPKNELNPNGINQCIHYGELFTDYAEVINFIKNRTNLKNSVVLSKENDVLMPTSDVTPNGLAKACCINLSGIILGGDILIIRTNAKNISGEFLARYIRHLERKVLQLVTGTTVYHLYASSIEKLTLHFPNLPEQQKIAACLSSLDELITAHSQKLDALKKHKKGLMQQLFPAEGQTVPSLRFPEFSEAGEWVEKNLKHICQMQAGKFVSASEIKEKQRQDLFPCFGGNGLRGFTKTYTHNGIYPLIGRQGALCGNINLAVGKFHATEHAVVTTPLNGIDAKWLFYKLTVLNLNQYATGQAQPGLSVENLEKIITKIPPNKAEQQKIAACLSSLDELITAHSKKLDALKKHKKGLMQQLFPVVEED